MNGEKTRFECFAGETKSLVLTIENEQENSEVSIAFVRGRSITKKAFSTKDGPFSLTPKSRNSLIFNRVLYICR